MIKKLILLPVILLSFTFSQGTLAHDNAQKPGCGCQAMQKMTKELDLTSEQQAKIKAIRTQARDTLQTKRQEMIKLRAEINALIQTDKLDEAKLTALINQKKEIVGSVMKTRITVKNQIYNVLNAQQKAKFSTMMDQKAPQDNKTSSATRKPHHNYA